MALLISKNIIAKFLILKIAITFLLSKILICCIYIFYSAFKGLSNDIYLEDVTDWKFSPIEFNVLCFHPYRTGNEKIKKSNRPQIIFLAHWETYQKIVDFHKTSSLKFKSAEDLEVRGPIFILNSNIFPIYDWQQ